MTRSRHLAALVALVAAAALAPAAGSVTPPNLAGLYFVYAMNCTFTVQNDAGQVVSSIPPGKYDVTVRSPIQFGTVPLAQMGLTDMTACKGMVQFQLHGPGVNLATTLLSGCGQDEESVETFAPSSTYVAEDDNQPTVTKTTFTTVATGAPTPPPRIATGPAAAATQSTDIVGSATKGSARGALTASLSPTGALTLTSRGKPVSTLKAGAYRITVSDRSAKSGVVVESAKLGSTATLTTQGFVGTRKATITLKAGAWTYYSGLGKIHRFVVTV
jgi:hypothetical protein